jgi:hypothetical protein
VIASDELVQLFKAHRIGRQRRPKVLDFLGRVDGGHGKRAMLFVRASHPSSAGLGIPATPHLPVALTLDHGQR